VTGVDQGQTLLNRATEGATREKCEIRTLCIDLECELDSTLGGHTGYDLLHVARYLHRPLMPILKSLIAVGGFIVYHTFMVPSMGKPRKPKFLLEVGELKQYFGDGFKIVEYREGTLSDGRPAQYICAQKLENLVLTDP